ncbi:MAG: mannose-1-phosphate guanylyltransferase/mannose-6-phosphate isomerase [Pseudomonadota bacterium]|nr:mannose-1-phosphate guanylyltransferase/mannose-6-phosphate isomerase [Pseudomonadota bacterium]
MNDQTLIPVVLSGGSGTRLWPLSRQHYPKQFLPLLSDQTLIQQTITRLASVPDVAAPMVVCNEHHRFLVAEQMRVIGCEPKDIILEPVGRNTAPAVAVAALNALQSDQDPLLLILPADHAITNLPKFYEALADARQAAAQGNLVTFGIVPTAPETGYGYIRGEGEGSARAVAAFVEKPSLERAESYVASGDYFWNSGMFLFRASVYLEELAEHAPAMMAPVRSAFEGAARDLDFLRLGGEAFSACPEDSIDYAVMERTRRAVVVPMDAGWSDVGSWDALHAVSDHDEQGNAVIGDVLTEDVSGSYLRAETRLLAAVGISDHIVVETADAVLVAHRDRAQDVKKIVQRLKHMGREESYFHRRVYRPWGWYEGIAVGPRFQVKHICVNPGASLSHQMHHHRAEHWIVVKGTARVRRGDEAFLLSEDQSTYIPVGSAHRLENPGKIPLDLIEVQSGSYLGEDDIVRFEDRYGR